MTAATWDAGGHSCHGARVASVTAKDKLRRQLQKGMDLSNGSASFSSQYADRCTMELKFRDSK